jgi:hypothetical protein
MPVTFLTSFKALHAGTYIQDERSFCDSAILMILDPKTTIGQLISALPSVRPVLQAYGLSPDDLTDEPLWRVLTDRHVDVEEFLSALDGIDWGAEFPSKPR